MSATPVPCRYCGGQKPPGRGRKACNECLAVQRPLLDAARHRRRQQRKAEAGAVMQRRFYALNAPDGKKWCPRCAQYLAVDKFSENGRQADGRAVYCNVCQPAYMHARLLWNTYRIRPAEYEALLVAQNGACAICLEPPGDKRLAVDHDHETGRIRGLLCRRCNQSIVGASGDNPALLRRAADYLEAE